MSEDRSQPGHVDLASLDQRLGLLLVVRTALVAAVLVVPQVGDVT